jgi:hypothetical protein
MFARFSIPTLIALIVALVAPTAGAATVGYFQDWNDAGLGVADWTGITIASSTTWSATGGNGGGYLRSTVTSDDPTDDVGGRALANIPDLTGDFRGKLWTLSFDILLEEGQLDAAMLRLRGTPPGQGWVVDLPGAITAGVWTNVIISFDANWTEAQARANGWMPDNAHPVLDPLAPASLSWADTVANVRSLSVRLSGNAGEVLTSGLDNFLLDGVSSPIPEPTTALLMGLGLLGLASVRRR